MLLTAIVLVLAALTPAPPARAAATGRSCGLVGRFQGRLYDVRETKGAVPCPAVRGVVTKFLRTGRTRPGAGWICFRGHGTLPWAASCARGKTVLVRVYAPT